MTRYLSIIFLTFISTLAYSQIVINEIMSKYFDQNVYDLMSEQEKLILEHLMMPFATEHGVDETFYKLVA